MITASLIAVALIVGYLVTVGLSMVAAFGIGKAAPGFVVKDYQLRIGYKLLNEGLWLVFVIAGSYLSAAVAESTHPWVVGATLAGILVFVPWTNPWETRQRGLAHQVLLSLLSIAGVTAGYVLRLR
jgi:hypothetical protein